jgi:HSP20 family protein
MNDPLRQLERLGRELGSIAYELTQVHFTQFGPADRWRPAVNAYRCDDSFIICADLAGIDPAAVQVLAEPRRLIIRGTRPPPEPACDSEVSVQVLAMEIDYGPFERTLELPAEVNSERVTAEQRSGLLWIYLPLLPQA